MVKFICETEWGLLFWGRYFLVICSTSHVISLFSLLGPILVTVFLKNYPFYLSFWTYKWMSHSILLFLLITLFYVLYIDFFVLSCRNRKYSGHYGQLPKRKRNFGSGAKRNFSQDDHRGWHSSCTGVHQWAVCGICGHRFHYHDDYLISLANILLYTAFPVHWLTVWKSGNHE